MSKKLNEELLGNELKGSAFFAGVQSVSRDDSPTPPVAKEPEPVERPRVEMQMNAPEASTIAPTSPRESDVVKIEKAVPSPILGRPKAFYITEQQDRDLDVLVSQIALRLTGRLNFKVDRSVVVRLILESTKLTSRETTDRLADQLVDQLVSRLTG
jgi:hypothetical protein